MANFYAMCKIVLNVLWSCGPRADYLDLLDPPAGVKTMLWRGISCPPGLPLPPSLTTLISPNCCFSNYTHLYPPNHPCGKTCPSLPSLLDRFATRVSGDSAAGFDWGWLVTFVIGIIVAALAGLRVGTVRTIRQQVKNFVLAFIFSFLFILSCFSKWVQF